MSPPLFSSEKENIKLVPNIQKHVDDFLAFIIGEELKEYSNPLVPFTQRAKEIRTYAQASFGRLQNCLQHGMIVLKKHFELQENQENQKSPESEDSSFTTVIKGFEELRKKMQEPAFSIITMFQAGPIQEQILLPWAFMDRAYKIAKQLLEEKSYEDAEAAFLVLRFLHSEVFEYWVGEACALQGQGKLEDAVSSYIGSLLLQPSNAFIFFQIASCLYQANEIPGCLKALELCLEHAKNDPAQTALMQEAEIARQVLENRAA